MSDQNCMSCVHWNTSRAGRDEDYGDCMRPWWNGETSESWPTDDAPIRPVQPSDGGIETFARFSCNEWKAPNQ